MAGTGLKFPQLLYVKINRGDSRDQDWFSADEDQMSLMEDDDTEIANYQLMAVNKWRKKPELVAHRARNSKRFVKHRVAA